MNMRFFNDLDPNDDCDPPDRTMNEHGYFDDPVYDRAIAIASTAHAKTLQIIPDLEVPPMRAQAATAGAQVRSTSDPIAQGCGLYLPHELALELRDFMYSALHAYDPCRHSSDYICRFCGERANTNMGEITHSRDRLGNDDCLGLKLQEFFRVKEEEG